MNDRIELKVERTKPGKFSLRVTNRATKETVVVLEGRANEAYDMEEQLKKVLDG